MNRHALDTLDFAGVLSRLSEHAQSPLGKEEIASWEPLSSLRDIRSRAAEIAEMRNLIARASLPFSALPGVIVHVDRAADGGQLGADNLFDLHEALTVVRHVRTALTEHRAEFPALAGHQHHLPEVLDELANRIDDAVADRERLRDDASPELSQLRRQCNRIEEQIRNRLNALVQSSQVRKYLQDSVPTFRDGRHVLSVKERFQDRVPGTVRGQSASGASIFIEPEQITALENELRLAEEAEHAEVDRILWELSGIVADSAPVLVEAFRTTGYLDAIRTAARLAETWGMNAPELVATGMLRLDDARNPLLLAMALDDGEDPDDAVVPTTLRIGESFDCLVITGPNTGGKTVALKTTGLCVAMALTGLPIPAGEGSSIPLYKEIWADIGDEQSLQQNLSTFSAHLKRIVEAFGGAEDGTLVLLDELGAGTDPTEGAALGEAILRELLERRAHVIATTHLGQLKQFGHTHPRAENGAVGFDPDTLDPTYELSVGTPGSSHALYIARRMGMPESVLEAAQNTLDSGEKKTLDELIAEVQRAKREIGEQQRALADERQAVRALSEEAQRRAEEAERTAQLDEGPFIQLLREVANDLGRITKGGHMSRAELRDELEAIRNRVLGETPGATAPQSQPENSPTRRIKTRERKSAPAAEFTPEVGATVYVRSLGRSMEVVSIDEKRGKAQVAKGAMKTSVPLKDLQAGPRG